MTIRRLVPIEAPQYRALMLEAYESHPDSFTSSASDSVDLTLTVLAISITSFLAAI